MWLGLLLALPLCASALFFDLPQSHQKCFSEIVGEDTKVLVMYENPDFVPFGRPGFSGVVRRWLSLSRRHQAFSVCAAGWPAGSSTPVSRTDCRLLRRFDNL